MKKIMINILIILFILIFIYAIASGIFGIPFFGYKFCLIESDSMQPEYKRNGFLIAKDKSLDKVKVGDVVLFKSSALKNKLVLHRVVEMEERGYYTKADAASFADEEFATKDNYIGVPVFYADKTIGFLYWFQEQFIYIMAVILNTLVLCVFLLKLRRDIKEKNI